MAGGKGTRLLPMTRVVNKHLLPVYDQPMIYYPLRALVGAGIREVCVVVGGREPKEFEELLGNGTDLGFERLTFVGGQEDAFAGAEPIRFHDERISRGLQCRRGLVRILKGSHHFGGGNVVPKQELF